MADLTNNGTLRLTIAAALLLGLTGAAFSQGRHGYGAGAVHPNYQPYGPGAYTENGSIVYVPQNCYVSREQVYRNGQLVWQPLKTCPSPGYR